MLTFSWKQKRTWFDELNSQLDENLLGMIWTADPSLYTQTYIHTDRHLSSYIHYIYLTWLMPTKLETNRRPTHWTHKQTYTHTYILKHLQLTYITNYTVGLFYNRHNYYCICIMFTTPSPNMINFELVVTLLCCRLLHPHVTSLSRHVRQ